MNEFEAHESSYDHQHKKVSLFAHSPFFVLISQFTSSTTVSAFLPSHS